MGKYFHNFTKKMVEQECKHQQACVKEFDKFHRRLKLLHPFALLFNVLILFLLFKWLGFHTVTLFFAVFISIKEAVQLFFLWRFEKKIIRPIEKLKKGLEVIAAGNYDVQVEAEGNTEMGLLIDSFNQMAQKLQESERLKSEYEENRKTLIANISHDLKTPITSIQGYIEALEEGVARSPEEVAKYLQIIANNTNYVNKLIDDLFLFSKLDMDKLAFNFEKVAIRAFIKDVMEELELELGEKGYHFSYEDQLEQDYLVKIDRKRLYQALRNIVGNAVKYGPENNLVVAVSLCNQAGFSCISIRDNGPGISADKLPYIFERFYRVDKERTKNLMSTGLGLAIAKELIEAHGGQIAVTSKEGQGSCFTIVLPLCKER